MSTKRGNSTRTLFVLTFGVSSRPGCGCLWSGVDRRIDAAQSGSGAVARAVVTAPSVCVVTPVAWQAAATTSATRASLQCSAYGPPGSGPEGVGPHAGRTPRCKLGADHGGVGAGSRVADDAAHGDALGRD